MGTRYRHLFGPVPSRRLGRSLGIDLTPGKTCSFDCIFCQLGRTRRLTSERRAYVPVADVTREIDEWLARDGNADYLTLSGSGEPTLHIGFGEVLDHLSKVTTIPAVLLTNSSLFGDPEVRAGAARARVVKASLGAFDDASLVALNRPAKGIAFGSIVRGLRQFRREFAGELWIEVFLVPGVNADRAEVMRIADLVQGIQPDRIQLNTAVRPPAEHEVVPVPTDRLRELADLFMPVAEVPAEFVGDAGATRADATENILDLLRRRPCTADQVAAVFGFHINEAAKHLGLLLRSGRTRTEEREGVTYHRATSPD